MFYKIHAVSFRNKTNPVGWITSTLTPDIPINGAWSDWSSWSVCSDTCDHTRDRACDDPPPKYSGLTCPGNDSGKPNVLQSMIGK